MNEPTVSLDAAPGDPTAHGQLPVAATGILSPPRTETGGNGVSGPPGLDDGEAAGSGPSGRRRVRRWLWLAAVLVVVAGIGAGSYAAWSNDLFETASSSDTSAPARAPSTPGEGTGSTSAPGTTDGDDETGESGASTPGSSTDETTDSSDPSTPDGAEPYEFVTVADDTGVVSIDVPEPWRAGDWAARTDGGFSLWAGLTPDSATGFARPGAYAWIDPAPFVAESGTDARSRLAYYEFDANPCTKGELEEWSRDGLSGFQQRYTDCTGDPAISAIHYSFTDADEQFLVIIIVHAFEARDIEAAERLVNSIEIALT